MLLLVITPVPQTVDSVDTSGSNLATRYLKEAGVTAFILEGMCEPSPACIERCDSIQCVVMSRLLCHVPRTPTVLTLG